MAKNTVISDFSALKGKMTFSEKDSAAVPVPSGVKNHDKPKNETILKVGQHVVLMDSNLRGKITALGRTVVIELEDGLTIEASYGEFAVTDKQEISALSQTKVKAKKASSPVKACTGMASSSTLTVDLHIEAIPDGRCVPKGQQLQFQMDIFRKVIRENLHRRGTKICFIHGIGDGILKAAIRKELDEVLALRCSYAVGDPAVTIVSIK